jgi:hypothetical protein
MPPERPRTLPNTLFMLKPFIAFMFVMLQYL